MELFAGFRCGGKDHFLMVLINPLMRRAVEVEECFGKVEHHAYGSACEFGWDNNRRAEPDGAVISTPARRNLNIPPRMVLERRRMGVFNIPLLHFPGC